ncbi:hypothetical protein [Nannocystis pusilla]|uniref:hypothetical protein n=1 Tax=Nannocystis pusilla TaxID=889268 RepID=UPI003B7A65FA
MRTQRPDSHYEASTSPLAVAFLTSRPPAVSTRTRRLTWFVRGRSVGIIFLRGACGAEDMSRSTLLLSLVTVGCYTDVGSHATALFPKDSDSSGASSWATSTGVDASAASGMPATTHDPLPATPGSGDPWSMTTGEPENQPPEILLFEIEPDMLNEAGMAHANASFNEKVTKLELKVNGVDVPVGAPAQFEWFFTATSKAKSDGIYQLELTAKDDQDQADIATATLKVELPKTGDPRCVFEEEADDGWFAGVVYGDALVLAGTLGLPTEAAVWRLDPDSCKPQFGSPWKISQWTDTALRGPRRPSVWRSTPTAAPPSPPTSAPSPTVSPTSQCSRPRARSRGNISARPRAGSTTASPPAPRASSWSARLR